MVLEKTLESPLDCKEIQPVHSKGDQPWDLFGRNDAKDETLVTKQKTAYEMCVGDWSSDVCSSDLKTLTPWKESYDQPRQHIQKQSHYFANKGPSSQGYGFSSSHEWM